MEELRGEYRYITMDDLKYIRKKAWNQAIEKAASGARTCWGQVSLYESKMGNIIPEYGEIVDKDSILKLKL